METLRHVVTACNATGGNRKLATKMRRQCAQVHAELAQEAGAAPARAQAKCAEDGWAVVQQGGHVTLPQWQAMHGVLGGAMPTWVDSHGRPNEDRKRAKTVSVLVRAMQGVLEERLKEHRRKAAPAAAWITEREERRGLIRHVFAAWAGTRGSHNVPDAHYSRDAWQEWRRRENPQQRKARRICEAVRRVASFAQCCFNKFWANRERNRRMLRLKLAVLRKVRACNNWSRTRNMVSRIVWRTRTARDKARWPKRISALMADVVERMRQDAARQQRVQWGQSLPARRLRVNLIHGAAVGPVLTDMYIAASPLGDG